MSNEGQSNKKCSVSSMPSFVGHIDVVDNAKYLRVQLDNHLVWDEHTVALLSKISRSLGPGGGHDLRMDGGLPPGFQKATLF